MLPSLGTLPRWLFASGEAAELPPDAFSDSAPVRKPAPSYLLSRWLFLRALGLIFFSAFYSLIFQVRGLIGPDGILPAGEYLQAVKTSLGAQRFWYAPTVLWLGASSRSLMLLAWVGIVASLLLVLNVWPRISIAVCMIAFLSFISALQTFSSYQSDGMLLCAGFVSLFFAPPGIWPGLGRLHPPSRASRWLLLLEWFTIYFESGIAKMASGDPEWRHLTAMDGYYQNGPLPTWIAWYAAHLPHWFHVGTAGLTLLLELVLIWMVLLPRPFRIVLFWIVTPWQAGIILSSNYAFLNYLVLVLGFLLLDDRYLLRFLPRQWRRTADVSAGPSNETAPLAEQHPPLRAWEAVRLTVAALLLTWVGYAIVAQMAWMVVPSFPIPIQPVQALEPFRIANEYGLFAVMTRGRYEVEFQGSNDGATWTAYPFRNKPQDPREAPGIYAPYQPRFDWNLWFASLGNWQEDSNRFVVYTEERLLEGSPEVLSLFRENPFPNAPPQRIRAVVWEYSFTDWPEKRQGLWWRRNLLGLYAPELTRDADGRFGILAEPGSGAAIRP